MQGPLKGLKWNTSRNYEYITGTYLGTDETHVLKTFLKNDKSVFYDIGAHVGLFSVAASRLIPGCTIYAFEPMPDNFEVLKSHLQINNIKEVQPFQYAVSNIEGEVSFTNMGSSEGNTYINQSPAFKNASSVFTVKSVFIDDLIALGYKPPSIIKIDVEGAELDVLKGAVETIKRYRPVVLLATHNCHLPGIKDKCVLFMQNLGYNLEVSRTLNKYKDGLDDFIATYKGDQVLSASIQ